MTAIDSLALKVIGVEAFTPEFEGLYHREISGWRAESRKHNCHPFNTIADLRPYGCGAKLYLDHKFLRGYMTLELTDVGLMGGVQIIDQIAWVVGANACLLPVARVDFTSDVPGVPLSWFFEHARVSRKRKASVWGTSATFTRLFEKTVETLYFGAPRKNCVRIYDKVEEWRSQAEKAPLSAAEFDYAKPYLAAGGVLTRVERQCRGRSVPAEAQTLGLLLENAPSMTPFSAVDFYGTGGPLPMQKDYTPGAYLFGLGLRSYVQCHGLAEANKYLNSRGGRNAKKTLTRYAPFLPGTETEFEAPRLDEIYQISAKGQFGDLDHLRPAA